MPSFNCNFVFIIRLLSLLYHLIKLVARFFLVWIPLLLSTHTAIIKKQVQISSVIFIPNSPIPALFCSISCALWYQINFLKLGFNHVILMIKHFNGSSLPTNTKDVQPDIQEPSQYYGHYWSFYSFCSWFLYHVPYTSSIQVLQGDLNVHQSLSTTALNYKLKWSPPLLLGYSVLMLLLLLFQVFSIISRSSLYPSLDIQWHFP